MKHLLFIALGGALGALARHGLGTGVHALWHVRFPVGTLLVNVLGSFLIGVAFVLITEKGYFHPDWKSVLMVGFLGAFTTFSTFSLETVSLFDSGQWLLALGYMLSSLTACVVAAAVAIALTRML
ncbi:MAG: fluoride efflux transporter CrcB [Spongiibacteraceae bacterium]|jgi:CrcB protein|nr:fluoride efflux transporter CrcB [Spongiibacteraceae bacterium]